MNSRVKGTVVAQGAGPTVGRFCVRFPTTGLRNMANFVEPPLPLSFGGDIGPFYLVVICDCSLSTGSDCCCAVSAK